jgi:alpha-1,4-digalacturonate transport system permease protein
MAVATFLTRTHGRGKLDWTDWVSYTYLCVGLFTMFAPIVWLVMSSLKTESALTQFPPTFLPYSQKSVVVAGHEKPLPLYLTKDDTGALREMAQVRRIGIMATMVDPAKPEAQIRVNINDRKPINELKFSPSNYTDIFAKFSFGRYLWNSVFITVVATLLTLLINSMAAFALSKYQFKGQRAVFLLIIATLMIPPTIILVPVFLVINSVGLLNSLWGVILPAIATPTGVFLLRQYMLTIPDELLDGPRQRMAHLLAHHPAAGRSCIGCTGDFLSDVALERFPAAVDRVVKVRVFHIATGAELLPGRAQHPVALLVGDDGDHPHSDHAGVRVPSKVHHYRHRQRGRQVANSNTSHGDPRPQQYRQVV